MEIRQKLKNFEIFVQSMDKRTYETEIQNSNDHLKETISNKMFSVV